MMPGSVWRRQVLRDAGRRPTQEFRYSWLHIPLVLVRERRWTVRPQVVAKGARNSFRSRSPPSTLRRNEFRAPGNANNFGMRLEMDQISFPECAHELRCPANHVPRSRNNQRSVQNHTQARREIKCARGSEPVRGVSGEEMIGTSLNQYEITGTLGAGGMGEVFRARDTRLNRDVAVKVLPKDFVADADRLRRFEQEAKTLAALNHPNILTIHDAGVHESAPYLVSELLEGQALREVLGSTASAPLPLLKATEYALQIAHGLAAAHSKGVIHRDLKPENIFVTKDGRVKILDFGLARLRDPKSEVGNQKSDVDADAATLVQQTEPGAVLGTPGYMSPEQVRGELADHRADIFAFGCVFYEMLSGTRAFRHNTPVEGMSAVLSEEPPDLSASHAGVPPLLERIVRRCLEKQPDNRFQSAKDLAFALENAGAAFSSSLQSVAAHPTHSHLSLVGLLPWAVAVLAVAFGIIALRSKRPDLAGAGPGQSTPALVRKFELTFPPPTKKTPSSDLLYPVISPDGRKLAYANADGLWLHWLDRIAPPLLLTAGENITDLFWSPPSTEVGYFEGRKVYRIAITGGNPMLVGTLPEDVSGGSAGGAWLGDRIILATGMSLLFEAPAQGGKVTTTLALAEGETDFHNASGLPDGRGALFVIHRTAGLDTIAVWSPSGRRKVLSPFAVK